MNNDILMFRFTLLVVDFVLMLISDEKALKITSGVAFILLAIGTIGQILY